MADNGWYFDPEMGLSEIAVFGDLFAQGKVQDAETLLIKHFEQRAQAIMEKVIQSFPEREQAIRQAFYAHINGQYFLSVPVLLAQADGIFKSVWKKHGVYATRTEKGGATVAKTANYVMDQIAQDTVVSVFLSPLECVTPLLEHFDDSKTVFDQLNRHAVLHGIDYDYGSKVNSLKAISFIGYVVAILTYNEDQ